MKNGTCRVVICERKLKTERQYSVTLRSTKYNNKMFDEFYVEGMVTMMMEQLAHKAVGLAVREIADRDILNNED